MPLDYRILRSVVMEDLQSKVNLLSSFGFDCVGGLGVSMDGWTGRDRCLVYSQAMSRECKTSPMPYLQFPFDVGYLQDLEERYGTKV